MPEEKRNEGNNESSLSPTDWVMFLSGEIHNCLMHFLMIATVIMACVLACIGGIIAGYNTPHSTYISFFLLLLGLFSGWMFIKKYYDLEKIKGELVNIREDVIAGESDLNKIRGRWEKIHKILYQKERSSNLEKSEIDDKIGMTRIGSANFWYALGGSCVAIGGVAISIGHVVDSPKLSIFNFVSGLAIFMAGISMIKGAYNIETKSEKRPVCLPLKELWHTNNWLFLAFLFLIAWAILNIIPYFL